MNKNKILSVFSFLLILTGIFILFLPKISSAIIEKRTEENVARVEDLSAKQLQENLDTETEFDFDSILDISPSQTFSPSNEIDESLILGRLFIPTIDLNLTIYNGVTNHILQAGVGTMRPDLNMGEGNFPIAGHYSSNKDALFGDLTSVELGSKVYLTDNDQIHEYEVYDTRVVKPSEVDWIEDKVAEEHGDAVVSLMNCYYVDGKYTDKRFFVFGKLVDSYDADNN